MTPALAILGCRAFGHVTVTDARQSIQEVGSERCGVTIVTAIATIWALSLLSLAFTLPAEFILPTDPEADATAKNKNSA